MIKFDYGVSPNIMIIGDLELINSLDNWNGILYLISQSKLTDIDFIELSLIFENKKSAEKSYKLFDENRRRHKTDEIIDIIFVEMEEGYKVFILLNMKILIEEIIPVHLKEWVNPIYTNGIKPLFISKKSNHFLILKEYKKDNKERVVYITHSYINSIGNPVPIIKKEFKIKNILILTELEARENEMIKNYFVDNIEEEYKYNKEMIFSFSEEENIKKRKKFLKYFYPLTIDKIYYEKYLKKEIEELNKKYEVTLIYQAICNLILKYRLKNEKRYFKNWKEIDVLEYLLQTPETFKSIYPDEKYFSLGRIESQIKFQNKKGEK